MKSSPLLLAAAFAAGCGMTLLALLFFLPEPDDLLPAASPQASTTPGSAIPPGSAPDSIPRLHGIAATAVMSSSGSAGANLPVRDDSSSPQTSRPQPLPQSRKTVQPTGNNGPAGLSVQPTTSLGAGGPSTTTMAVNSVAPLAALPQVPDRALPLEIGPEGELIVPDDAAIPAVMAANATQLDSPTRTARAGKIAGDFVDQAAAPSATAPTYHEWETAADLADARYQSLYGVDAFMLYKLQAAKEALRGATNP